MKDNRTQLKHLQEQIIRCTKCSRLVEWREKVAKEKVRRFADEDYWGKPIPSFGDFEAKLLLVGLAPAAHGGNRTGRIFTGDRSGDWLFDTLHRFGFANQSDSSARGDGLALHNCYITAALRCAPPQNKPKKEEKENCFPYLLQELQLLPNLQVVLALGKIGFDTVLKAYQEIGQADFDRRPKFGHGHESKLNQQIVLLASYHPSQQNTFTGKLTQPMFDAVFKRAKEIMSGNG
ncbi:uracil-DNA glycosylase [candidate division KSB1 bacterium]|nr:uracil-DNA glycosylase [candidate division KSB1 bacterium]NIR69232.1 uracil-DNA glycosylase [candidate division KSB1 bacterium]NIS27406.1 uracil-DNA glycosylase [candidate division KSB1 bacterium]NIT74231.1 uracil-DNA glycosylase [candidate division KSB1 bacterium]NIU28123.1 uracil-DNA glycosylase [candidate division KSB1 bacterium]